MFVLRQCLTLGTKSSIRNFSASTNLINVTVNEDTGVAIMELNRPPVNSLNYELLEAMHRTLVKLENDRCRGMILTSTSPTMFSAGLDILEMYKPTVDKARKFWGMLQNTWIKLYSSPYPTVAAINGHSPAGGCLLALSCEYRVMVPKKMIGLNETKLGIVAPQWFQDCMKNVIGVRQAEKALIAGTMFSSEQAAQIGLVDELATDREDLLKKAHNFLDGQLGLPPLARRTVKVGIRKDTLSRLVNGREADTKYFIDFIFQPKVQESLEMYLQSLKKK
ncbi:enoyl-CoA delta isomerase 1, mitochondrial isoform X2 [Halyomorpha halys]|uniref:enoyl-CoA delta isomerase 1, mitochondrial isoform X2 n=1 Tax=Halyomorpha halys TaxID=286706 RepID=UPI0006D4EB05|nr:enoyl-CoA delta isomerase 1, mitochondrial [Halyomorpha halys]XP_014289678.1 enoyl-CoA delta isomerase 1, mitochondrial [Halyomorpha halys]